MTQFSRRISEFSRARLELLCTELKARLDRLERSEPEPVAIVGMACRFPGGVTDVESFWQLLRDGIDAITELPPDRWPSESFYDPDPNAPGKTYSRHGGFVGGIDEFDPLFFNISPREAVSLDPQYRLLLEVTWEALEAAGQNPQDLRGTRTGVFVGVGADDYAKLQVRLANPESITAYTGTGNAYCYGVGRLSYVLGLQGPNFPVDTACSSSLVVTHLACQSLRRRECDLALAGGVHLMLSPVGTIFLSKARALSPGGRCKPFDASADGFVRGEGCGIVVLRRLSDAIAHHDHVHAIIRGSAINHDGPSSGFTVPNGVAQQAVIQAALADAQVDPRQVSYVEAHGTGTSLGDPIEVRALAATLGRKAGRSADRPLVLGSIKANVGHLEPAAGVAGLMKTILALEHEAVPPQLHIKRLNPQIPVEDGPFVIPRELTAWPRSERPRIAGVSSFGLSGTNAHVIVQEAPATPLTSAHEDRPQHVLTLSAKTETALRSLAGRFEQYLSRDVLPPLGDICYTANTGRALFSHRLGIVGRSVADVREGLAAFVRQEPCPATLASGKVDAGTRPRLAFLFTGEGTEHAGMGDALYRDEPRFREAIHACDEVLRDALERPLASAMYESRDGEPPQGLVYRHLSLFAVEYGLLQLWRAWGIQPSAVVGHGLGEYVAAVAAGVLGLGDALRVVLERARVAESLRAATSRAKATARSGDLRSRLQSLPDGVALTAINSPAHAMLTGEEAALRKLQAELQKASIKLRIAPALDVLYTPRAIQIGERVGTAMAAVQLRRPQLAMISGMFGHAVDEEVTHPSYWVAHTSRPVRFASAVEALFKRGHDHFLELGPKPALTLWAQQCVSGARLKCTASLGGGDEWGDMLAAASQLYVAGVPIDWNAFDAPYKRQRALLPTYPFERQRYWVELSRPVQSASLITEADALKDAETEALVQRLLERWGGDGARAVNRRVMAPLLFLSSTRDSFFYANQAGSSLVLHDFVGAPEAFESAAREVLEYVRTRRLNAVAIASEDHVGALRKLGLTTTPVGVWQSIPDLRSFDLQDARLRSLRTKVAAYRRRTTGETREYRPGTDRETDRRIVDLMHAWRRRGTRNAPFATLLQDWILNGALPADHRIFLTRRADEIDSVIILSRIAQKNGYLLDLEFYTEDMPAGCLESSIISTIELLKREGSSYYSLGSTFGTQLDPDPAEHPQIQELLRSFHAQGILNDDGNFEFKKKFAPVTSRMYLCAAPETDLSSLPDVLLLLAAPERVAQRSAATTEQAAPIAHLRARDGGSPTLAPVHPLLGRQVPLASKEIVFESVLEPGSAALSWLRDHRILDQAVFPAAGYLEMGLALGSLLFDGQPTTLRELTFLEALHVPDDQETTVQTLVTPQPGGGAFFRVFSRAGHSAPEASPWTLHANGSLARADVSRTPDRHRTSPSLADARNRSLEEVAPGAYYERVAHFGLDYGGAFRAIQQLYTARGEALARAALRVDLSSHGGGYVAHPVLIDACLQVQGAALLASDEGNTEGVVYVPTAIERVLVHDRIAGDLWARCELRSGQAADRQELVGDIHVWNASGRLVAEIDGLTVTRTSRDVLAHLILSQHGGGVLYQFEWRAQRRTESVPTDARGDHAPWMVFADAEGTGERLASLLRERGQSCVTIHADEALDVSSDRGWRANPAERAHFARVLEAGSGLPTHIVYLWSSAPAADSLDLASIHSAQRDSCQGVLYLVQALVAAGTPNAQLWIVTRGAHRLDSDDALPNPAYAPVWALGRTISQEHPEIWGGMIDLDPRASELDAGTVLDELWTPDAEDHVAFRRGERHVARLVATDGPPFPPPVRFRRDAAYLITGGLGGLGLTVARWMVACDARHLVLCGRAPESARTRDAVRILRDAGAETAVYIQADISRADEVERLLLASARELPPLRGIVHAAGVLADGMLLQQTWPRFLEVMAPKIDGAWHLHTLTRDLPLDHFILFSSSASILGAAGQGNYAAANAFLDGLAHFRRGGGQPALSVNWGPWAGAGMSAALSPRAKAQRLNQGIRALSPPEALRLMEQAIATSAAQIGAIAVDWQQLLKGAPSAVRHSSIFKDVFAASPSAGRDQTARSTVVMELREADENRRRPLVGAYIAERVAEVLGLAAAGLDVHAPLTSQGFDSLMALELRERLEAELGIAIPILTFFRSNTVAEFTGFVLEELAKAYPVPSARGESAESPQALLARLDELSDDEVELALRRELER